MSAKEVFQTAPAMNPEVGENGGTVNIAGDHSSMQHNRVYITGDLSPK